MADENKEAMEEPETFTKEDVEKMMRARLQKQEEEMARIKAEHEALQAQMQPQIQPQMQPQMQPQGQPQMGVQSEAPPEAMADDQTTPTQGEAPLTASSAREILDQHQQNMQAQQARNYAVQKLQELRSADPEFHKLATEGLSVPEPVAISIMNRLNPDVGKTLLKSLLSNTYENATMENHYLKGQFEDWLSKKMNNEKGEQPQQSAPEPDLSGDSIKDDSSPAYESALDDYVSKLR